jgi:hypothetical protein
MMQAMELVELILMKMVLLEMQLQMQLEMLI